MDACALLAQGALAGLGVAMPLGAIGVLLLSEGIARGFRGGVPGAVAVSLVDTLYGGAAVAFGAAAAPVVRQWGPLPAVLGGLVLIVLAVLGLVRSGAAGSVEGTPASPGSAWQRFGLFLGLTAINPATLVYFAAVTVGLGEPLREARAAAVFVAGIGLTSLLWQLIVVGTGAVLRHRVTERTRRRSRQAGSLVVAALGVGMLIGALP